MLHFVGFKDPRLEPTMRYLGAERIFGPPDFLHRRWDRRAIEEICTGDVVVFAQGNEFSPAVEHCFDDSAVF